MHVRPELQLVPEQQSSLAAPHSQKFAALHVKLGPQDPAPPPVPGQQGAPCAPQRMHIGVPAETTQTLPCPQFRLQGVGPSAGAPSMPDEPLLPPLLLPLPLLPLLLPLPPEDEPSWPDEEPPVSFAGEPSVPAVASSGSVTVASGAPGGGGAMSIPFPFTSLGSAQYDTPCASFAQTRPVMPSTLQSADTVHRLRHR
jgi:hypothetical protein